MLWSFNFWSGEWNTANTISDFFHEESDYSEQNTNNNEHFCSIILQSFKFEPEQIKTCGNESHEKETKYIYTSAAN